MVARQFESDPAGASQRYENPRDAYSNSIRQFGARQTLALSTESWPIRHFSQANPEGSDQGSASALLRRVADSIDALGMIEVHDITFSTEVTADGPWHSMTVYFSTADDKR